MHSKHSGYSVKAAKWFTVHPFRYGVYFSFVM